MYGNYSFGGYNLIGESVPVQVPKEVPVISLDRDHTHLIIFDEAKCTIETANDVASALSARGIKAMVLAVPGNPAEAIAFLELKDRIAPPKDLSLYDL